MEAKITWLFVLFTTTLSIVKAKYYTDSYIVDTPTTVKKTHLHIFFVDTVSGVNASSVLVAKPNGTVVGEGNPTPFGTVFIFDDPIIDGSDPNSSNVIGNVRGLYASTSRGSDVTLLLNADFEFTSGEFNGSSISVFSRDPIVAEKEVAVVGGRGKFRMAQGFILMKAVYSNTTTHKVVLECNVTIFHQ